MSEEEDLYKIIEIATQTLSKIESGGENNCGHVKCCTCVSSLTKEATQALDEIHHLLEEM